MRYNKPVSAVLALLLLVDWCAWPAAAQEPTKVQPRDGARTPRYYISLGADDELTMKVNVWGQVSAPGQYLVPSTTDLVALISFAGGPTPDARLSAVKIVRGEGEEPAVMEVDMKRYMETARIEEIPMLKPGDTVLVPGSAFYLLGRLASVASQIAIIANVYYWFFVSGR